jgi:hypothetical protein
MRKGKEPDPDKWIREAQKHVDPDPQHCVELDIFYEISVIA